jgi:hypothetical protein
MTEISNHHFLPMGGDFARYLFGQAKTPTPPGFDQWL